MSVTRMSFVEWIQSGRQSDAAAPEQVAVYTKSLASICDKASVGIGATSANARGFLTQFNVDCAEYIKPTAGDSEDGPNDSTHDSLLGVGSHLKKIFEKLGVSIPGCFKCGGLAARMNKLGPHGCRQEYDRLVKRLRLRSRKVSYKTWIAAGVQAAVHGIYVNPLDPIPGLLERAIRSADSTSQSKLTTSSIKSKTYLPISVVVISHNYGRYLPEALDSLAHVSKHSDIEILVVDDSSTDNTGEIASQYGVWYYRHDAKNTHESRKLGFQNSTRKYICFLDADDKLPPDYLSNAVKKLESDSSLGIIYSDLQHFGASGGHTACNSNSRNIEHDNYIHAGSVARRSALETSGAMRRVIPMPGVTHDWIMWRDVVRTGWKTDKNSTTYLYRKHPESMTLDSKEVSYYHRARLADETVTVVVPLSGRDISPTWDWLLTQQWPRDQTKLLLVDTLLDGSLGSQVAKFLPYRNIQLLQLPIGRAGLADEPRDTEAVRREVQAAVAELYSKLRNEVTTEYCVILEDDVTPRSPDAISQLMCGMDHKTASVSGVYWSRFTHGYLAWDKNLQFHRTLGSGVEQVYGTGFGCLLIRKSVWTQAPITTDGRTGDYDIGFFDWLTTQGYQAKVHWDVHCSHGGLVADQPWKNSFDA